MKRTIAFVLLLVQILLCFTGCTFVDWMVEVYEYHQMLKKLPLVEEINNKEIMYDGCIYYYLDSYEIIFRPEATIGRLNVESILKIYVQGCGKKDFGEYVFLQVDSIYGPKLYVKEGIEIPDILTLECDRFYFTIDYKDNNIVIYDTPEDDFLCLKDVVTEWNEEDSQSGTSEIYDHDVLINLTEYEELYLSILLSRKNGDLFSYINRRIYKINDEFKPYFENALKELEEKGYEK